MKTNVSILEREEVVSIVELGSKAQSFLKNVVPAISTNVNFKVAKLASYFESFS